MTITMKEQMTAFANLILEGNNSEVSNLTIKDNDILFNEEDYGHAVIIRYISSGNFKVTHLYIDDEQEEQEHVTENLDLFGIREVLANPPY